MLLQLEVNQQRLTDEIMEYKELLDEGIITEEEFSVKEEELLFSIRKISIKENNKISMK